MKAFQHIFPNSLQEVVALLNEDQIQSKILAGGLDLLGEMKEHIVEPDRIISISHPHRSRRYAHRTRRKFRDEQRSHSLGSGRTVGGFSSNSKPGDPGRKPLPAPPVLVLP